jgi:hypothetical protein
VTAGHWELDAPDGADLSGAVAHADVEPVAARERNDVLAPDIGKRREAVGDDAAVLEARDDRLHLGMVDAKDSGAVEGDVLDELDEGVLHRIEASVMVEMLRIDIGHHRDLPVEAEEASVALVGLHHHPVRASEPGVGAVGVDDAAVDDGGVDSAGVEHGRDHRGGRGLAVRSGDRDGGLEAHQLGEHLGALDHGDPAFERALDFRVAALDRGRDHHHRRVPDVFVGVADHHLDALLSEALDDIAFGDVGALHLVAEDVHHLGDTDMPIPPMPTKWMMPISVPTPFIGLLR